MPDTIRRIFVAVILAGVAANARAADLVWEIVEAWNASGLEAGIERLADDGFTVQAVVLDAERPTVLLAREGWSRTPRVATYRVLGRDQGAEVDKLAAAGWNLHRFGAARDRNAVVVLAKPGAGAAVDLRSVLVSGDSAAVAAALEPLYQEGRQVVAALGGFGKTSDWLILGATAQSPRDLKVVANKGTTPLAAQLATLASEGYGVDALWSRGGGNILFGGTKEVLAVVSRPAGNNRPVAHTKLDLGDEPSTTGELVAIASYGNDQVFAVRQARSDNYNTSTILMPTSTDGEALPAYEFAEKLRERLRSQAWRPIERAWFTWSAGRIESLVLLERESRPTSSSTVASAEQSTTPAVPPDASALPEDGGEPAGAWWAVLESARKRDVKAAKARWTGAKLARWNENVERFKAPFGMGFSEKELFESAAEDLPTDSRVLGGWVRGDDAMVRIEATTDGTRSVADLTLRREGGVWKIADESSWRPLP